MELAHNERRQIMKANHAVLAILVVTALVASPMAAIGDIVQRPTEYPEGGAIGAETDIIEAPISIPEGGEGSGYRSPPVAPENPNPPDPGGDDLITMSLVWLGLL
jgi:hypothetical protein